MENQFSAHHVSHGLVQGPLDYSVILNWTYGSTRNVSAETFLVPTIDFSRPALSSLGFVSATLIAFLLSSHTAFFKIKDGVMYQNVLQGIFVIVLFSLIFPIFAIFAVYRCLIYCFLKMGSSTFISLMDGCDAVWNLRDSSQPIIMVLAEIEADGHEILLKAIRDAILKVVLMNPKLTWTRINSQMGFSYWEMCNDLSSLKEHVHWMPTAKQTSENHITSAELQELISDIAHHGLPGHNSCWEILVSQQKLLTENEDSRAIYPVLFRIHHSLGDGISLLQLLINSLSTCSNNEQQKYSCKFSRSMKRTREEFCVNDFQRSHNLKSFGHTEVKSENTEHTNKHHKEFYVSQKLKNLRERPKSIDLMNYQRGITEVFVSEGKIRLGPKRIVSHLSSKTFYSFVLNILKFFGAIGNNIQTIKTMIYSSIRIRRTCETSLFDANKLSGEKLIAWHTDSSQGNIFSSIKRIKSQVKGVRFIDVFLTALSGSMEKYLSERNAYIPNCISVVIPVFMKEITECVKSLESEICINEKNNYPNNAEIKLQNTFSVGVLNLPIKTKGKISHSSHLKKVALHTELMYKSGQFEFYSFILKWVTNMLPEPCLNSIFQNIGHNTMVVSNLVGPANMLSIAGYPLKNIYFWVPHRGNTGVSVSILSYCNRLQLGIMVDKTIISTAADVQCLLNEAVSRVTTLMD